MLRLTVGIAFLLVTNPAVFAQQGGNQNYATNYASCLKDLSSQACNRELLSEAELSRIANKDSLPERSQLRQPSSRKILSQSSSPSKVARGETVTIIPSGPSVNQRTRKTVSFFPRGEVPPGYSGDYIEYDNPNNSGENNRSPQRPYGQPNEYSPQPSNPNVDYGPDDSRATMREAVQPISGNRTSGTSSSEVVSGLLLIGLTLFVVIWLLKLLVKGARRMASVTAQGVDVADSVIGSIDPNRLASSEFDPFKAFVAGLWIMTLVGLIGFPYSYYVILRLGFIIAFIVAIMANHRQDPSIYRRIKWPYVGMAIYVLIWGLPFGLWIAIDIVFLVLLYRTFWWSSRISTA